ncbi:hypothetical protein FHS31_001863 [Sphingomonas vulcanisoli]|uniref:Reverse transcriptase domain-containing protein n=1 Tax=Sphingomonas vulcanisoli TaxID=1658060 RepID=A0ABX0TX81_9SPHN|nr:hypothetical protein [Sphingomonas vulcanisoli]NIJ08246.1 hypothetical protein [Sphingomonas vulcanisoli]
MPTSKQQGRVAGFLRDPYALAHIAYQLWPFATVEVVNEMIEETSLFEACVEPIEWYLKRKRRGGRRPICEFGYEQHFRHAVIRHALDAQLPVNHPFYDVRRAGPGRAVIDIAQAIEGGRQWIWAADIRDCFCSIDIRAVYQLCLLPTEVIRCALDYRHLPLQRKENARRPNGAMSRFVSSTSISEGEGPRGLLQGSPASNALLRHILFKVTRCVHPDARLFVYSDNIIVVAPTPEICGHVRDALTCELAGCLGGPLRFGTSLIQHASEGLQTLGYYLGQEENGGEVIRQPDNHNLGRLEGRIPDDILSLGDIDRERLAKVLLAPFPAADDQFRELFRETLHLSPRIAS